MDECEKKGRICPPALKCLKQKDKSYACDCDPGYKIVGEGNNWTCKGTITDYSTNGFLFPRPLSTFMCQCRRHLATVIASGSIIALETCFSRFKVLNFILYFIK